MPRIGKTKLRDVDSIHGIGKRNLVATLSAVRDEGASVLSILIARGNTLLPQRIQRYQPTEGPLRTLPDPCVWCIPS